MGSDKRFHNDRKHSAATVLSQQGRFDAFNAT